MQIERYEIPPGVRGTLRTIEEMQRLVAEGKRDPDIIQTARIIVRHLPNKDYYGEAEAIFKFVKDNIRYVRDPEGVELLAHPLQVLKEGQGDCDELATLFCALAAAIGMQTGFEAIRSERNYPDEFSHVYPIVQTSQGWRAADTSVAESSLGWRPEAGVFGRRIFINRG